MFEQSTIVYGPQSKRLWTTCLGMSSQVVLVATAVLGPMVFPQVLPTAQLVTRLLPPLPPPPPPGERVARPRTHVPVVATTQIHNGVVFQPTRFPDKAATVVDEAPPATGVDGVPEGLGRGAGPGVPYGKYFDDILKPDVRALPAVRPPEPVHVAQAKPAIAAPPRRVSEGVVPAVPVYRPDPKYPPLARVARVSGAVEMEGVIATDGHIKELRLLSGHALLAPAAMDTVRQWMYRPTSLNGAPVEVITRITVTFRLD
jgi:protein TonB